MPDPSAAPPPTMPPRVLDPRAALLSYLLPGLGQVLQGRIGKGLLFFFGIYGLFFYGLWMGQMKNVWVPPSQVFEPVSIDLRIRGVGVTIPFDGPLKPLAYRPQFLGQFWVGAAVWPAIVQNVVSGPLPKTLAEDDRKGAQLIGRYMITPTEDELNMLQRDSDKRWELAWVYTLIAGALNLLVIYDAFAGPAIREDLVPDPKPTGDPA